MMVGRREWEGRGGETVSVLAAHSLFSLPPLLPVGLKRSMALTGKEKEEEEVKKKEGEWGGCLGENALQ